MNTTLRQQVISTARKLFMEKGYDAVGMREIANAVGRQPTQVYRLKLSKADILAEIILTLNAEQIEAMPSFLAAANGTNAFERTCAYLHSLYAWDIACLPLRAIGAAHGWLWSAANELAVIQQVQQLLAPISNWLAEEGFADIPAHCFAIWSLYYVGYRRAVMHGGTADDCMDEIRPSLALLLSSRACTPTTSNAMAGA